MTAFARKEGSLGALFWTWEAKSVNGKGLDLRCHLPPGCKALEPKIRQAAQATLQRGNLQITLTFDRRETEAVTIVNQAALERCLAAALELVGRGAAPPTADGLLSLRGVLELAEPAGSLDGGPVGSLDREAQDAALLADLRQVFDDLIAARRSEGRQLEALLLDRLDALAEAVARAEASAAAQPEALKARLKRQLEELLEAAPALPEERLAQEAALLAVKADLREEIGRLGAHIATARSLIAEGKAVGRRLDFLCQELNREANTLCSKAQDIALTEIGLAMKSIVDQLREQVQNVE
ncbi:MAG: YicC family protein [Rhodospirillales bacterium]|nr:YicC family protein [Rhodospirillales bacterium]